MTSSADEDFPVQIEHLLASIFEMLKEQGAAREIAILVNANAHAYRESYDNWNGGTYGWGLRLGLDLGLFSRLSEPERHRAEEIIVELGRQFFREFDNHNLSLVLITPKSVTNPEWRTDASAYLAGAGISNQGRVRSDNIASRQCDGLLFRSEPEIHLYGALKSLGVTFAPLPVFLRGGRDYVRLEPDFVLLKDGVLMVVEVDGDTYHRESVTDAYRRLSPLDHEGAKIERIPATDCSTPSGAKACAEQLLRILEKRIAQGRR
ncbi:hypothetical protein [Myxococcus qinghaiensis]|uniref:hypothetical protein n=1 Tax=Myxococcus qinghaiensis TaxID=2906758 RepID=UPI0020A76E75|nr:hypothetical protein [Myxococcus qinghaiensis]MCP3167302.1 hypothetical protein [Myxococcus qinghaiensis]